MAKYHPDIVYFDWWIGQSSFRPNLTRFAAFYYNSSLKYGNHVGVINYKDYTLQERAGVLDLERGQLGDIRPLVWQTDTSVSNKSWGYIDDVSSRQNSSFINSSISSARTATCCCPWAHALTALSPRGGQMVLLDVGAWLSMNGEAIYGTRPWRVYGEGPTKVVAGLFHDTDTENYKAGDFRFPTKGDVLYAIGLSWPTNGEAVIRSLSPATGSKAVQGVALLGGDAKPRFEQRPDGLHVQLPGQSPAKYAYVLRVTFGGGPH